MNVEMVRVLVSLVEKARAAGDKPSTTQATLNLGAYMGWDAATMARVQREGA